LYWLVSVPLAGPHWSRQVTSVVIVSLHVSILS
jgi:hypothetical protein